MDKTKATAKGKGRGKRGASAMEDADVHSCFGSITTRSQALTAISVCTDLNKLDEKGFGPLHLVRNKEVASALLDAGARANCRSGTTHQTPLHLARDAGVAKLLIKAKADVNATDSDGCTPLHLARDAGVAKLLIKAKADVNATDSDGCTPLHLARDAGVAKLLIKAKADVNATDSDGCTPLHLARDAGVAKRLIKAKADVNAENDEGQTPLHLALTPEKSAIFDALIGAGADVNLPSSDDTEAHCSRYFDRPLHVVKHESVARALIDEGADVDAIGGYCDAPLHRAANVRVARALLDGGADIELMSYTSQYDPSPKGTPLMAQHNEEVALLLLKRGANFNTKMDDNVNGTEVTALSMHIRYGNFLVVRELLRRGARAVGFDVGDAEWVGEEMLKLVLGGNLVKDGTTILPYRDHERTILPKTEDGTTILHMTSAVQALIDLGADVNARNDDGNTPLHINMSDGADLQVLIENGADIDAVNHKGDTPLHVACTMVSGSISGRKGSRWWKKLRFLIKAGASRGAKNKEGKEPCDLLKISMSQLLFLVYCECFEQPESHLCPNINR